MHPDSRLFGGGGDEFRTPPSFVRLDQLGSLQGSTITNAVPGSVVITGAFTFSPSFIRVVNRLLILRFRSVPRTFRSRHENSAYLR
jgi:hypothetical protein